MTVESASYISQLDTTLPTASDLISEGDDHLRLTKTVLKTQFPNFGTTAISASAAEVNYSVGVTSAIQTQINGKGAIAGQAWTGAHSFAGATSVPTLSAGTNTTGAASTAFVQADFLQKFPNYTAPVNASTTELNYLVGLTGAIQPQLSNQVSGPIHAATAKTTPADADELGITDSAASWGLKKLTFANLKAWIGSFFVSKSGDTINGRLSLGPQEGEGGQLDILNPDNTTAGLSIDVSSANLGRIFSPQNNAQLLIGQLVGTGGVVVFYTAGVERLRIAADGSITSTGGLIGYGAGSGGTVTQATSKSTAVTLNKPSGLVTMHPESLGASSIALFQLSSSAITESRTVTVTVINNSVTNAAAYRLEVLSNFVGGAFLRLTNTSAGALGEALQFQFNVHVGATS